MTDEAPAGAVVIPPEKVYQRVLSMGEDITKLTGLMERHIALQEQTNGSVKDDIAATNKRVDTTNERLDGVVTVQDGLVLDVNLLKENAATKEKRRTPWPAIVAAIGTIVTVTFLLLNQYNMQIAFLERIAP